MRTDVCRVDKSSPGFNCAIFGNLPECPIFRNSSVAYGRWSTIICREYHIVNV